MANPSDDEENLRSGGLSKKRKRKTVYGQMTCEGAPDCWEETTDHSLMGHSPQELIDRDMDERCYIPKCSTETNCISVTNNCN